MVIWFLAVAIIPTIVSTAFVIVADVETQKILRRLFIVLLYLNPWYWGSSFNWDKAPSKRETFLIVWFLAFILTALLGLALLK